MFQSESALMASQRGLITATRRLVGNYGSASTWRIVRNSVPAQFRQCHSFRLFAEYSVLDSSSLHFVLVGRQSIAAVLRAKLLSSIATVRSTITGVSLVVPSSLRWLPDFRHTGVYFLDVVASQPAEVFHSRFHGMNRLRRGLAATCRGCF